MSAREPARQLVLDRARAALRGRGFPGLEIKRVGPCGNRTLAGLAGPHPACWSARQEREEPSWRDLGPACRRNHPGGSRFWSGRRCGPRRRPCSRRRRRPPGRRGQAPLPPDEPFGGDARLPAPDRLRFSGFLGLSAARPAFAAEARHDRGDFPAGRRPHPRRSC